MNLEEYLKYTCTQIRKPMQIQDDSLNRLSFYILGSNYIKQLNTYMVYSSEVYPRYIRLDENDYIIWDNHFWYLYKYFLWIYSSYIDLQLSKEKCIFYCKSLLFLFLSSRFERIPSLSRYIAEEYKKLKIKVPQYDRHEDSTNILTNKGYLNVKELGYMFGYCHEVAHIAFKEKNQLSNTVKSKVMNYCEECIRLYNISKSLGDGNPNLENIYSISKLLVENNDRKILEEICCDIIAMYTITTHLEIQGADKKEIADKIACIDYFLFFIWWISSAEQYWAAMRMVYLNPSANDCAFVDEKSPFYNFGDRVNKELAVRSNFTYNFFAKFSKISIQERRVIGKLLYGGFYDILKESQGFDVIEKVLTKYSRSRKDFNSGLNHICKKNRLVGWLGID